ncbi:kinesin light chain [Mycobacterium phage Ritam007]|nr:hypothetical protein Saroj_76 [Mycobacterium phage Saroj]UZV39602.1 kinesin light chain [Mycobacterium phage Ritam007]
MNRYTIRVDAKATEFYEIEAESEEDARARWDEGEFLHSEVYDAHVDSVELIDE